MRTFSAVVVFVALALVSACSSKGGGGNPVAPSLPTMVEIPAGYFTYVRDMTPPIYEAAVSYPPDTFQFRWVDASGENKVNINDPFLRQGLISWDPATNTATLNTAVRLPNDTEVWVSVDDGAKLVPGFASTIVGRVIYIHGTQINDVRPGAALIPGDTSQYDSHAVFQIAGII